MNNAVFGKCMENVCGRHYLRCSRDVLRRRHSREVKGFEKIFMLLKYITQQLHKTNQSQSVLQFWSYLSTSCMISTIIIWNKSILKLLFTDTDPLCYVDNTKDIYKGMEVEAINKYDFSASFWASPVFYKE